jgi:cytochrome c oxidase subunit 2
MALLPPYKNWKAIPLGKDERIWSLMILLMILMMGIFTTTWVFMGKQNVPEEYTRFEVADYAVKARTSNSFENGVGIVLMEENQRPALSRDTTGDIYLIAGGWKWVAEHANGTVTQGIQLKAGIAYKLHVGSIDTLHGFQLIGGDFIISIQIVPNYDYVIDFIPQAGFYRVICNEYCGTPHHTMTTFLEVI